MVRNRHVMTSCPLLNGSHGARLYVLWLIEAVILVGRWPISLLHPTTSPKCHVGVWSSLSAASGLPALRRPTRELLPELLAVVHPSAHRVGM